MGLTQRGSPWQLPLLLISWVFLFFSLEAYADDDLNLRLVKTPLPISPVNSAAFEFEVSGGKNGGLCGDCSFSCKLDNDSYSDCSSREVSYKGLRNGDHTFEVCTDGFQGFQCASHNWTVDTVPPTASISAATSFTSMSNVSVHIIFNKPCSGRGGFRCSSDYCSLLVYGAGYVTPSTLKVLQPDLEYALTVAISTDIQYGRLVLVMDKNFCTDTAGNLFTRTQNSSFLLHIDRRNVSVQLRTHVPKKLIQLNGMTRTVEATNNHKNLRVYLYFSEPVLNSSRQILDYLHTSSGSLSPTSGDSLGNRRFGYTVSSLSSMAIVTVTCETMSIISRQGAPISSLLDPVTFLYDAQRPSVKLSTVSRRRTTQHRIPVLIKFMKPVFDFKSSAISISGGHLLSFHEMSKSIYSLEVHADESSISIVIPENTTADVAGNKNLASNLLQLRYYTVPTVSSLVSTITTVIFAATSLSSGLLTVSTANLLSLGLFPKPATYLISEPSRNLLRLACHIQVFALTKWLAVTLPVEYYEFVRGIEWSIPYLSLPWETEGIGSFTKDYAPPSVIYSEIWESSKLRPFKSSAAVGMLNISSAYGTPLTPMEYRLFLEDQNMKPEAQLIMGAWNFDGWKYFGRNMFWLAVLAGGFVAFHAMFLLVLNLRRKKKEENELGAVLFPRFEIFLLFLSLPATCQASATIIRVGSPAGVAIGIVLLGVVSFLLLSLFLFLSVGITFGKLLHYKEVHQESQLPYWFQELVRVSLGPGKRGQWTWKDQPNSPNLTRVGPLFEDLRGPPKYMLSQFSGGPKPADRIIASDDETEDAEATVIQKVFGILRIYYTLIESVKRVALGILAGIYSTGHQTTRTPTVIILSITAFQLFFLVLKKPFIKKRVQFVEIVSVASELIVFATTLVILERNLSESDERKLGLLMLGVFVVGYAAQLVNEWYALYWQVLRLCPGDPKFISGLKTAVIGVLLSVLPSRLVTDIGQDLNGKCDDGRSPATSEKPWMKQLMELAKESFSKEEDWTVGAKDPSTSKSGFWSGKDPSTSKGSFWGGKRSGSSSVTSSSDFKSKGDLKAKSRGLYKDLEAIFSSKQ